MIEMTQKLKNQKISKAIALLETAEVILRGIDKSSNYDDYKHYANNINEIINADNGEAGLKALIK
ncbi:hypothetical protein KAH94_05040 [bacterium]|nr:hypothetical protein [bacterium]